MQIVSNRILQKLCVAVAAGLSLVCLDISLGTMRDKSIAHSELTAGNVGNESLEAVDTDCGSRVAWRTTTTFPKLTIPSRCRVVLMWVSRAKCIVTSPMTMQSWRDSGPPIAQTNFDCCQLVIASNTKLPKECMRLVKLSEAHPREKLYLIFSPRGNVVASFTTLNAKTLCPMLRYVYRAS